MYNERYNKKYIPNVIVAADNPATKIKSTLHFIVYVD